MDETFNSFTDEELNTHDVQISQKLVVIDQKIARLKAQKTQLLQWKDTIQSVRTQRRTNQQAGQNWEDETFLWSAKARQTLREVFGLSVFRPQQLQTINALLSGNDVLLLAPTGGGKSLCFQLPALISNGLTVVISPLIALMEDQVWAMQKLSVEAKMLCNTTEKDVVSQIHKDLTNSQGISMKLLYVTPERMSKSKRFMTALQKCYNNGFLDRFAIDEVHCCSQWGHDFRPDYKYLGVLKEMFPKAPLLGVTATATSKVITDVQKMLNIPNALMFVAKFNRPNLYYHVLTKPNDKKEQYDLLANLLLDRYRQQSGIIYTFSVKDAVDISTELKDRGLKVAPYHATLEAIDRTKIHHLWLKNELQAVVATVAFGMGIDKSDVRFVIHHTISKSLENYYQESGRAGRDGQRADCIVMYHFADIFRISTMTFSERTGLQNTYAMVEYCNNVSDCRRKIISRYFSEVWGEADCAAMCDRCVHSELALHPKVDVIALLAQLKRILSMANMMQIKLTGLRLVDAWMHKGPTFLRLSEPPPPFERAVAEQIVGFFIINHYLKETFTYTPYTTLSYLVQGNPPIENSIMVRVGKLFELPNVQQETEDATSANRKTAPKKRSVPTKAPPKATKKAKNNSTEAAPKAKRSKNAPPPPQPPTPATPSTPTAPTTPPAPPTPPPPVPPVLPAPPAPSGQSRRITWASDVSESEDEDVVILTPREDIIEIDGE